MNRSKKAFSLLEISAILIAISVIITMVITSTDILGAARLNNARNITKSSIVNEITGVTLWLDSTSVKSFDDEDIEDGDEIENWNDIRKSFSSTHTATATATKRPLYDEDAINKLPGVKFDGVNDHMQIASFSANAYMTLFAVGKFSTTNQKTLWIEHSASANANSGFYMYGYGTSAIHLRRLGSGTNFRYNLATTGWFGSETAIGVVRYDGTNLAYKKNDNAFINDVFQAGEATTIPNETVTSTFNIGSRNGTDYFTDGSFGEIIMYNRALSDTEVDDVLEYLNSKWEIY